MISKDRWAAVLKDFQEKELPEIISRDVDISLTVPINRARVIIGPRRAGKTYLMYQLIRQLRTEVDKKQIFYVNFEKTALKNAELGDLSTMLEVIFELYPENKKEDLWLFLDEVQLVNGWELFVRSLLDDGIRVFVSGSSAKLLSKEIATSLRGRGLRYDLMPFSFTEFLRAKNIQPSPYPSSSEKAKMLHALSEYFLWGGYPEVVLYPAERQKILEDIKETVIFRDVVERHKVRNVKVLRDLIEALANSKEFSVHKYYNNLKSRGLKVSKDSLYDYMGYLNDAFFVFPVHRYSPSRRAMKQSIPKIYLIDNGFFQLDGIEDRGKCLENLVFLELLRRGSAVSYHKFANGSEIDFIVADGKKISGLLQACYDPTNFQTREREISPLIKGADEFGCQELAIVTWDYEAEEKHGGRKISFVPLWKWLLKKK